MGFAVWGQAAYGQAGDTVEGGILDGWVWRPTGRQRFSRRRANLSLCLWRNPRLAAGEFGRALFGQSR